MFVSVFDLYLLPVVTQERDNGFEAIKLSDRDFLRSLENAIRFGKPCLLENVGEELDPALEPVLLQQVKSLAYPFEKINITCTGSVMQISAMRSSTQFAFYGPQTFKQQGSTVLKLGDSVIPYHEGFKMYITTKLPNPHYSPEVSTNVTLINFTVSPR